MKLVASNPLSRFQATEVTYEDEFTPRAVYTLLEDHSRGIVAENNSPDIGFSHSVNPYRGCFHGCAYCYARPGHEYLSFGAGTDFDRKIVYKPNAAALLEEHFQRTSWKGDLLMFSGVTDCYQPAERSLQLTRGCLEVCAKYRNPVAVITKSPLIERDLDLFQRLHATAYARVAISIPFSNEEDARALEPAVAPPKRRLETIRRLTDAGIRVGVSVSPIIPGLSDSQLVEVLEQAKDAGASFAFYVLLRLPGAVKSVFEDRVRAAFPLRAEKILRRIRETRGGSLYQSDFATRQSGTGIYAETISQLFQTTRKRLGFSEAHERGPEPTTFARPTAQMSLF